jgi:p-hydroxybenzoate 3-monooxygenase
MSTRHTRVAIIGAGPAGLILAHLLARRGIDSRVLERRSRSHVESRVRAGVLEPATVELLRDAGVGARLDREGILHHGIELRFGGASHRIDFDALVPGHAITIYGQREVVKDLIEARLSDPSAPPDHLTFEVSDVQLSQVEGPTPRVMFTSGGARQELSSDWVIGCDGFHGVSRHALPHETTIVQERKFPVAWLGVLAHVAPSSRELIYAHHERGFALHSMRSAEVSRFYLQVAADENIENWSDQRIWTELRSRLETVPGWRLQTGPIVQKNLAPMRSFAVEPMRHGRLFLAGDAAHIVPPTGAKGLNLALLDAKTLAEALGAWYERGDSQPLDSYSEQRLRDVWRVQRFSCWMTRLLHTFPSDDDVERRLRRAELDEVVSSRAFATLLAESYVGRWRS